MTWRTNGKSRVAKRFTGINKEVRYPGDGKLLPESENEVIPVEINSSYDEAKNEPFLGGHLSPELNLFDQILP